VPPIPHRLLFVAAAAFASTPATRAAEPHDFSPQIRAADFAAHVRVLASDEFAGRDPATRGETRTLDYLTAEFRRLGLAPGNGDSYLQPVPLQLRLANMVDSRARLEVGGTSIALSLEKDAVLGTDTGRDDVVVTDSAMVFVGYGIDAPELGWNDYDGIDVRGKTVLVLAGEPRGEFHGRTLFDGERLTIHSRAATKFEQAARRGAVAALVIHDTEAAGYDWNGVRSRWQNREYALQPADRATPLLAVQGWLSAARARALFAAAGLKLADLQRTAARGPVRAQALDARFSATLLGRMVRGQSSNVTAMLRGTKYPDEAVLYCAHWDHLGKVSRMPGDNIFNGALDNASGVAALLEIAARFAAQEDRPERSIVFLLPTLEELGLLGSTYYTKHPVIPLSDTVAAINFDMVVPIGRARDFVVIGRGYSELDDIVAPIVERQGRRLAAEPTADGDHFLRSDHVSFARAGVPVLYMRGGTQAYGAARSDPADGGAWTRVASKYHTPDDEFAPGWDLRGVADDITVSYEAGAALAASRAWPNWREGNAFRAVRDASRAEAAAR
jgi:Zn-dependent M28 family amino/carboxypeptidase